MMSEEAVLAGLPPEVAERIRAQLARHLHLNQTFDAECFASNFGDANCPCQENIDELLEATPE